MSVIGHTVSKYKRVYLPWEAPAFEANLDELARQGWELVCTVGDPRGYPDVLTQSGFTAPQQIRAIFRRVELLPDETVNTP